MKLIQKDSKSTNSNEFVIIRQKRYRAEGRKKPGVPLKVVPIGGYNYVVYHLDKPGILDDNAVFQDFFETLEEAKEKYPDVEVIDFGDK